MSPSAGTAPVLSSPVLSPENPAIVNHWLADDPSDHGDFLVRRVPSRLALPERRLWRAVLEMAIRDLGLVVCGYRAQPLRDNARAWIRSRNEDLGSFVFVCDALGLEADAVREELLSGRPIAGASGHAFLGAA
jgi:hypothetical protein